MGRQRRKKVFLHVILGFPDFSSFLPKTRFLGDVSSSISEKRDVVWAYQACDTVLDDAHNKLGELRAAQLRFPKNREAKIVFGRMAVGRRWPLGIPCFMGCTACARWELAVTAPPSPPVFF